MTRLKISNNRVNSDHGSNSIMMMLFTMTWHFFSPSVTIHQPSEWPQIAVRIFFVVFLSCALGKTVYVLIVCRATHTVMKLCCITHQRFRALPVTVLFIWLISSLPFPDKNVKNWFEDIFDDVDSVGSALGSRAVLGQIELLLSLHCAFVSLPSLLQSILTKNVLLNVQLITCLQNTQVPTKYVLFIKINWLIQA